MFRFEVFKDINDNICMKIFSYQENKERILDENETLLVIKEMTKHKIKGFYEIVGADVASISLEDCIITIKPFYEIINDKNLNKLRKKIISYQEKTMCSIKIRKVIARIKKHTNKCILPLTLTATLALSSGISDMSAMMNNEKEEDNDLTPNNKYIDYSDNEWTTDDVINQKAIELFTESLENGGLVESQDNLNISVDTKELLEENKVNEEAKDIINLSYEDRSETDKAIYAKDNYGDIIQKYSNMYGLDSRLVLGIATQERGVHSNVMDEGGATGLMQVQNAVWEYQEISVYNFGTRKYESFIITPEMLQNVETNIKVGCCIFQKCLQEMNYNIIAAIQCYNFGCSNMRAILNAYAYDANKSVEDVLNDPNDIGWLDYRTLITIDKLDYVENVLSWIGNDLDFYVLNNNNEKVSLSIQNEEYTKSSKSY